jgi:hypothetical protein
MQAQNGLSLLCFMMLFAANCWTQEPAPPLDPTPLERPIPLSIVKIDIHFILLDVIADTLESYKFDIVRKDEREQLIEAKRLDSPDSKDHDKVLIWLERDFQEPQKYVKIFLQYGRYLEIWSDVKRIKINPEEENERNGKLKKAIISISKLMR